MSQTPNESQAGSPVSPRWRAEQDAPTTWRSMLLVRVSKLLLLAFLVTSGTTLGLLSLLSVKPVTLFFPAWIMIETDQFSGDIGPVADDQVALEGCFPEHVVRTSLDSPKQHFFAQLQQLQLVDSDTPILFYFSGWGKVDSETNVSLLLNQHGSQSADNRMKLSDLLLKFKACPSTQKLLVLDIASLGPATVQEQQAHDLFAEVEREVAASKDEHLVVITSCSAGQQPQLIYAPHRSIFGFQFEQALKGRADGFEGQTPNGRVDTRELADYLTTMVANYAQQAGASPQTPRRLGATSDFDLVTYSTNASRTPNLFSTKSGSTAQQSNSAAKPQAPSATKLVAKTNTGDTADTTAPTPAPPQSQKPAQHSTELTHPEYPTWLIAAWQSRDNLVANQAYRINSRLLIEYEKAILDAENNWRRDTLAEWIEPKLQLDLSKILDSYATERDSLTDPVLLLSNPPFELAVQLTPPAAVPASPDAAGGPPQPAGAQSSDKPPQALSRSQLMDATATLLAAIEAVYTAGPEPQIAGKISKLVDAYLAKTSATPTEKTTDALYDSVCQAANLHPRQLSVVATISEACASKPRGTKTAILVTLAQQTAGDSDFPWPLQYVQDTLRLIAGDSDGTTEQRVWPWLASQYAQAANERYVVETLFWHPAFVSHQYFKKRLESAKQLQSELLAQSTLLQSALDHITQAHWVLPQYFPILHSHPHRFELWKQALEATLALEESLSLPDSALRSQEIPITPSRQRRLNDAIASAQTLERLLGELSSVYSSENVAQLAEASSKQTADTSVLAELRNLLSTSLLETQDRVTLFHAAISLSKRLHHSVWNSEKSEAWNAPPKFSLPANSLQREVGLMYQQSLATFQPQAGNSSTGHSKPKNHPRSMESDVATRLLLAQHFWAKRASIYLQLSQDSPLAEHYAGLAQRYRRASNAPSTPPLVVAGQSASPPLSQETPQATLQIPYMVSAPHHVTSAPASPSISDSRATLQVACLPPTNSELIAHPSVETIRVAPGSSSSLRLKVEIGDSPATPPGVSPQGFFAEIKLSGATYLHRVSVHSQRTIQSLRLLLTAAGKSEPLNSLDLRPSATLQSYQLQLQNLESQKRVVKIVMGATAIPVTLGPLQTIPIPFTGKRPKTADEFPDLVNPLHVQVLDSESSKVLTSETYSIKIAAPREYVEILSASFTPFAQSRNRLEVWLRGHEIPAGPPCTAELRFHSDSMPGFISVSGGKVETELPTDGSPTLLYAENLRFDEVVNEAGRFEIAIDGVARSFLFESTFACQGGPTTPRLVTRPQIQIKASERRLAGPEFPVRVQVDNAPIDAHLDLSFAKPNSEGAQPDLHVALASPQKTRIGFVALPAGELLFSVSCQDWDLKLDTTNLVGRRDLTANLALGANSLAQQTLPISLDNRPPDSVRFSELPSRVAAGTELNIQVSAESPLTGIQAGEVFLGEMKDGKPPAGAPVTQLVSTEDVSSWTGQIAIPKALGTVQISAIVTNGAGLTTVETQSIDVVPAKELDVGNIAGQVFEGVIRQPNLEVILLGKKNQLVAKTKTRFDGQFEFESIPAGQYTVHSSKPANGRKGGLIVNVAAGQTARGDVSLSL
ncbi:carboxypeptidase-like regulatory domain-containing protein [Aureliella helgolandensis]|uniref:Uncharacterized protein n=1 Tax=Aureliella helgolandensis TaxID=2527968 RepID=A0A518G583_9BACT|nr:carboxypeptidase-like regulatory domain-containing protein [Aureliella helgolandensis]QDV23709.1 hypothetical protein Q31a_20140 [Aureliella helgolandensis]